MKYNFSPEQLEGILRVLSDDNENTVIDMDSAQTFFAMAASLARAVLKENQALRSKNSLLSRQVERMRARYADDKKILVEEERFSSIGLSDTTVAYGILYFLQQSGFYLSSKKFMLLFYMLYASILYHKGKTLCVEIPSATERGPVFWKAKDISVITPADKKYWDEICSHSAELAGYMKSYLGGHGSATEGELEQYVLKSSPYMVAMANARRDGKKAYKISLKDIYLWKEEEKHL